MDRAFGYHAGGIVSLDVLIEAYRIPIEFDLIDRGLRLRDLGTDALTWGDLWAICKWAPTTSALARALHPEIGEWQLGEQLLADVADSLHWLVWSKTKDAQRSGARPPNRIPRPGVVDEHERIGTTQMSPAEMDKFLGWNQEAEVA